ncbi:MAG: TonB-dependent receptor [Rhodomicrobium sp.]
MRVGSFSLAALLAAVSGFSGVLPARADEVVPLDPITVTATGSNVPQSQSPASVSVVTGSQIESQVPGRIGDALLTVPGLYMNGSAFDGNMPLGSVGTINMRGVPGAQRTLILVDGVPFNSPLAGQIDYSQLPTFGIDRIEVVPGPYSALYGSQALGGVINIISQEPTRREFEATGSFGGDNPTTGRGSISYRDVTGGGLGIALDFSGAQSTGFKDTAAIAYPSSSNPCFPPCTVVPVTGAVAVPSPSGPGYTNYVVGDTGPTGSWSELKSSLRLYYDFSPETKLSAGVAYSQSYIGYGSPNSTITNAAGVPVYNGIVSVPSPSGTQYLTLTDPYQYGANPYLNYSPAGEDVFRTFARFETQVDDIKIKATVSYMYDNAWYDGPSTSNLIVVNPQNLSGIPGTYASNPANRVLATIQAEKPLNSWNTLTVGTQVEQDWVTSTGQDLSSYKDPNSLTGFTSNYSNGWTNTLSVFIQDKIDFTSKLHLYLGAREDFWSTQGSEWAAQTPATPSNVPAANSYPFERESAFSPKASLVYQPMDELTLRTSAGQGFRTPDILTLYTPWQYYGLTTLSAPNLKPETSESWEAGADWRPSSGTRIRATYYENYLSNFIDFSCNYGTGICTNENAAAARVRGVELSVEQTIDQNWSIFANLTRNWSRMEQNLADPASVGANLTFTPDYMTNFGVKYTNGNWSGVLSGRYVSKVYANEENTDTATGYPEFYDPYVILDAKVSYQFDNGMKLSLIGKNLTGEHYYEYYLQPGRTIWSELSYRF